MNDYATPSYLFNALRRGAEPFAQASRSLDGHSATVMPERITLSSLESNREASITGSRPSPTPAANADSIFEEVSARHPDASPGRQSNIPQTDISDFALATHNLAGHSEDRISEQPGSTPHEPVLTRLDQRQAISYPETAVQQTELETIEPTPVSSESLEFTPLKQERSSREAEIEQEPTFRLSEAPPSGAESMPFSRPETESPPTTEKNSTDSQQKVQQAFRVIEEEDDIPRQQPRVKATRAAALSGMAAETLPATAPVSSEVSETNIAGAGQSSSSGESPNSARSLTAAQMLRTPRLISAADLPITVPLQPRSISAADSPITVPLHQLQAESIRSLPTLSPSSSPLSDRVEEGRARRADAMDERSNTLREAAPDDARDRAFNETMRRDTVSSRQESAPKLTIHRLDVQIINQISQASTNRVQPASPAPSPDAREILERRHLGRFL